MRKLLLTMLLIFAFNTSALANTSVGVSSKWNAHVSEVAAQMYLDGSLRLSASQKHEVDCLAKAIFFEARGESLAGKVMVANVVFNRVKFGKPFSTTICGVIYQPRQFSWTSNKWKKHAKFRQVYSKFERNEQKSLQDSLEIALKYVILKPKNTGFATHFSSKRDKFGRTLYLGRVGNHSFYQYLGNA